MKKYSKHLKQIVFFVIVGGVSFLIDLTVTTFLYKVAHFPAYISGVIGFLSSFFFNFPINRKHVFNHTEDDKFSLKAQATLFAILCIFNLITTGILIEVLVNSANLPISISKILTTGMIATWNFLLFKFYIFSKRTNQQD